MAIRLKREIDPGDAIRALDEAAGDLENRRSWGNDAAGIRNQYLQWVGAGHRIFLQYLGLARADELIHSTFYWYVLTMNTGDPRAGGQLYQGMTNEALRMRQLVAELKALDSVLGGPPGWLTAVVDTNALVQVKPPWDVDWAKLLSAERVCLLLPLRVVEELDKFKYGKERRISQVARNLLPQLEARLTEDNGTMIKVNERLIIKVPILPGERDRTLHADEEILRLREDTKQFGKQAVVLVTADTAMRIQARARGIRAIGLPADVRRMATPELEAQPPET